MFSLIFSFSFVFEVNAITFNFLLAEARLLSSTEIHLSTCRGLMSCAFWGFHSAGIKISVLSLLNLIKLSEDLIFLKAGRRKRGVGLSGKVESGVIWVAMKLYTFTKSVANMEDVDD